LLSVKETNGFFPLRMKYSIKRPGHTAKREKCHGRHDANIYAYIATVNFVLEFTGIFAAGCKNGIRIVVWVVITDLDRLI